MNARVEIDYATLGFVTLIRILELADLMGVTPKVAAESYLKMEAQRSKRENSK